jgi:aspartyl-tRNA(Asn)/glutamyl-tRNA(Gln) amidotransferase subunit C
MPLSPDEVRKVARLARLDLPANRVEAMRSQLDAVLGYVARLRELDLAGVEPLTNVADAVNRLDPDVPGPTLPTQTLMKLAPDAAPPFLKVPKVLDQGAGA